MRFLRYLNPLYWIAAYRNRRANWCISNKSFDRLLAKAKLGDPRAITKLQKLLAGDTKNCWAISNDGLSFRPNPPELANTSRVPPQPYDAEFNRQHPRPVQKPLEYFEATENGWRSIERPTKPL